MKSKATSQMTAERAAELVRKHGTISAASRAAGSQRRTIRKWLHRSTDYRSPAPSGGAFALKGARLSATRPVRSSRQLLYTLDRDKGYPVGVLAKKWGRSEETIRQHATGLNCLRWIEDDQREWHPVVLHPETAKDYPAEESE